MTVLHLSRLHFPVTSLGPGNRIGLWVQGCSIRCAGCISLDTWAFNKGATTVTAVRDAIAPWLGLADGLTISGGEPLDQAPALECFLREIGPGFKGDVLLYTGYPVRTALEHPLIKCGLVDAVVPEPLDLASPQTKGLRGSDNQPLIPLTDLGKIRYAALVDRPPSRRLDIMFDEQGIWFAGIPNRGEFPQIAAVLRDRGHHVITTEDTRDHSEEF